MARVASLLDDNLKKQAEHVWGLARYLVRRSLKASQHRWALDLLEPPATDWVLAARRVLNGHVGEQDVRPRDRNHQRCQLLSRRTRSSVRRSASVWMGTTMRM